jgi:hypothetical protein
MVEKRGDDAGRMKNGMTMQEGSGGMKNGILGKVASGGGGVTAEFGFRRTRAAREGACPAGMTALV